MVTERKKAERKRQLIEASKVLFVIAFALLYGWGGMEMKQLRRFVAPVVLCLGMCLYSRDWKPLLQSPLMMLTLSMGYGAETLAKKFVLRIIYGAANSASSISYIAYRSLTNPIWWMIVASHVMVCMIVSVVFGVYNPFPYARTEEFIFGWVFSFLPIMTCCRKEEEE